MIMYIYMLLAICSILFSYDENILKSNKLQTYNTSKKMILEVQKTQNYLLLAKPNISYQYQKRDIPTSPTSDSNSLISARIEQDIFKSGGLYFSITKAKIQKELGLKQIEVEKKTSILNAYKSAIGIKKIDLSIKKQKLLIQNKKHLLQSIKDQHKIGLSSTSRLGNELIGLNALENSLYSLLSLRETSINALYALSDKSYKNIKLWHFKDKIKKEEFIAKNDNIAIAKLNIELKDYVAKETLSNYFPKLSLFANYTDVQTSYGAKLSWTLNPAAMSGVEYVKLDTIKTSLSAKDIIKYEGKIFFSLKKEINIINKQIQIIKKSIKHYDTLILDLKNKYNKKLIAKISLDAMINTKKISQQDLRILNIDKHLKLVDIYKRFDFLR